MKKKFVIVIIVLIVILGSVYAWRRFIAYETAKYLKIFESPVSTISVVKVASEEWHGYVSSVGSTVANQGVEINTEVNGQITKIYFKSGEKAEKGQPIIQLNPKILEAQLANDNANLHYSKVSYYRQKTLLAQNATSQSNLDKAFSLYKENMAKIEQSEAELAQTLIRAPFTGLLGIRQVNVGEYLTAGSAIVSLQALQPMFVDFNIPANEAKTIQKRLSSENDNNRLSKENIYRKNSCL